jgi:hypothetical protein
VSAEELVVLCKEAIEAGRRLGAAAKLWQGRYRRLLRRAKRARARLQTAIEELEEAERFGDVNRVRVRNALEILYDVVKDLEVSGE